MASPMTFNQVVARLRQDGFKHSRTRGSHHLYKHPTKRRWVVVPRPSRGNKEIAIGTLHNIYHQAGWDWKTRLKPKS